LTEVGALLLVAVLVVVVDDALGMVITSGIAHAGTAVGTRSLREDALCMLGRLAGTVVELSLPMPKEVRERLARVDD
jgi:hypothetical protein